MTQKTKDKIKVAQFGLGPIGIEAIKLAGQKQWAEIVGGVDVDPTKIGRTISEVTGDANLNGAKIYATADELLEAARPDVVLHCACSTFSGTWKQIEPLLQQGVSVVSSCEEMIFPQLRSAALAEEMDQTCRGSGARAVAAGVNPGFVMDILPICLTGVSRSVRGLRVERIVDATTRREPLQRKIGSGMDPEEFRSRFREGKAGHAGLKESLALLAHSLGWKIGPIEETCEPMIAPKDIRTKFFEVKAGLTCGLHQRATAKSGEGQPLELDLSMYLEAENPRDVVTVDGDPKLTMLIQGGVAGDSATVASLVNTVPRLLGAAPGLKLLTNLPVPGLS